jgi:2-methylaconitate cis-trans-isomerase PrpF
LLVRIEHPMGEIQVTVDAETGPGGFRLRSAGLVRTARLLARGEIMVPARVWNGTR